MSELTIILLSNKICRMIIKLAFNLQLNIKMTKRSFNFVSNKIYVIEIFEILKLLSHAIAVIRFRSLHIK